MDFQNMFRALVLGSSVTAAGCGGREIRPEVHPANQPAIQPELPDRAAGSGDAVACEEICNYDAEPVCPDPTDGFEGCCWLMQTPHPCCDFEPGQEALGDEQP